MPGFSLDHDVWVLVADGEKGLILRNEGDRQYPNLEVVREMEQENPPTREQGTDRPGRMPDGPGIHRSAVDDTDWHRVAKERFAEEMAQKLYKSVSPFGPREFGPKPSSTEKRSRWRTVATSRS